MRVNEILTEIERLYKGDYEGGKGELGGYKTPGNKVLKPLPGGSGLQYGLKPGTGYAAGTTYIFIVDPNATMEKPAQAYNEFDAEFKKRMDNWERNGGKPGPAIVAKLSVEPADLPIPNAVQVGSITVDEDYRGRGLAKALYGIVLSIMGKTLVAGSSQTPGGRRNWVSLVNIPGVEMKGFVQLDNEDVEYDPDNDERFGGNSKQQIDRTHDTLMRLGGQFVGQNKWAEIWAFDVVPGKGELKPAIRTALSQVYDDYGSAQTGLFARWTGR